MIVKDNNVDTGVIITCDTDNNDEKLVRYSIISSFCLMLSESVLSSLSLELTCTQMHLDSLPQLCIRRVSSSLATPCSTTLGTRKPVYRSYGTLKLGCTRLKAGHRLGQMTQ